MRLAYSFPLSLALAACGSGRGEPVSTPPADPAQASLGGSAAGGGSPAVTNEGGTRANDPDPRPPSSAAGGGSAGTPNASGGAASRPGTLTFVRKDLHHLNLGEAASFGDYDQDGALDLSSGPYWWAGPDFENRHEITTPKCTPDTPQACDSVTGPELEAWAEYTYDVDGDGWLDSIHVMRPDTPSHWYKNPGAAAGSDAHWQKTEFGTLAWEQTALADMAGTGALGLVGVSQGAFGWFELGAESPWPFHVIDSGAGGTWEHGIGAGNVDGGGGLDFLSRDGWWSPPAAGANAGPWTKHPQAFKDGGGGCQMFAYDVNGDGRNDVVSALNAHGYGVAWFERSGETFVQHDIVGGPGAMNPGGIDSFSQPHNLAVVDMDGDGLADVVTGKTYYAHPPGWDPGDGEPPVTYVFKLLRDAQGAVSWEPHLVDSEVGVGKGSLSAVDFDGDGSLDLALAGKKGVFLFFQK